MKNEKVFILELFYFFTLFLFHYFILFFIYVIKVHIYMVSFIQKITDFFSHKIQYEYMEQSIQEWTK